MKVCTYRVPAQQPTRSAGRLREAPVQKCSAPSATKKTRLATCSGLELGFGSGLGFGFG